MKEDIKELKELLQGLKMTYQVQKIIRDFIIIEFIIFKGFLNIYLLNSLYEMLKKCEINFDEELISIIIINIVFYYIGKSDIIDEVAENDVRETEIEIQEIEDEIENKKNAEKLIKKLKK